MARVDYYVDVYTYIYIYKIAFCGLLALKPVMYMIEQMVGVQSYYIDKMGHDTARSPILFVDLKETQISLKCFNHYNCSVSVF